MSKIHESDFQITFIWVILSFMLIYICICSFNIKKKHNVPNFFNTDALNI